MPKFCKDCKYCKETTETTVVSTVVFGRKVYLCERPRVTNYNLVTGEEIYQPFRKCSEERQTSGRWCGQEGYYFESKDNEQST